MIILVTGGAGFIGSNFILYWLNRYPKDKIINLDKLTYAGNLESLESVEKNPNYEFVHGDICNTELVDSIVKTVDKIVHFAAESHVDRSILDPKPFIKTNIEGTYVLLESALKYKIKRFHHISTDEVFGALPLDSQEKFSDLTPYNPRSPYSASKAASDHLVRSYFTTYDLPITISNCSNNFGPRQFPEKLIPLTITNIIEGLKIPIYGDGQYIRDWLHVDDHCKAIDLIINKGIVGETYLVGGKDKDISNIDVVKKILKIMNKTDDFIEYIKDRPGHDRRYAIDSSKIEKGLDWKPECNFEQTLKRTVDWYVNNQSWWKKIKSGEYQKYYEKQYKKTNASFNRSI